MSRVGIEVRLRAIREAARRHDERAYALHHLSPKLRRWHDEWEIECRQIAVKRFGNDQAARYEAALAGDDVFPPMPPRVAEALNIKPIVGIPITATVDDAAEMYRKCLAGEL